MSKEQSITTKTHLSDDLLFLITCCHTNPSENDINFIHSYLNAERLARNALIPLANQHGVLPLVYLTLRDAAIEDQDLLSGFKQAYMSIAKRSMLMSAELIRIMKLLEENNIEALAFKGPALSQMAYGNITLRQYSDLDILIQKKDVYKAGQLLINHNYQLPIKYLNKIAYGLA